MSSQRGLAMVSVRSVRPVLARLASLDLDVASVLEAAGLGREALDDPAGRIPHQAALAVWREAVERSGDADFGMHAAEQIRPGAFDVLDYAIRSSTTLGEGLERLVRYHRILHDAAVVQLERASEHAQLSHTLPSEIALLPRQPAEFIVAGWLVVARQATGRNLEPLAVMFRHPEPRDVSEHRRVFRAPVSFSSATNGIVFDAAMLELPLLRADPGLCAVLERHVLEIVSRLPSAKTLRERVQRMLADHLSAGAPSAESVARRLHMSVRTLQRQLREEGTTIRAIIDELRRALATRYLEDEKLAIAEIAFLLGFSEQSAFHRAFRRWNGSTPAAYRRERG